MKFGITDGPEPNPTKIKTQTVYVTTDGRQFTFLHEADAHQLHIDLVTFLAEHPDIYWRETDPDTIAAAILAKFSLVPKTPTP
jgi:hypothetical protein